MNRRGFLSTLAAGFAIDPEKLLWRPGAKIISIPRPSINHRSLRAGDSLSIAFDAGMESISRVTVLLQDKAGVIWDLWSGADVGLLEKAIYIAPRDMEIIDVKVSNINGTTSRVDISRDTDRFSVLSGYGGVTLRHPLGR